jgi:hypothetical protein
MKNMLKSMITGGLSFQRLYRYLMFFVLLIPVAYGAYLLITMAQQGTSFSNLLTGHPLYSVMFLTVMLDIIWGYLMFMISDQLGTGEGDKYAYCLLVFMAISQLAVGNLVIVLFVGFILINMDITAKEALTLSNLKCHLLYSSMMIGLIIMSSFCCYALIRITYYA